MLLALSAAPEELDVAMISVTYGNVPLTRYGSSAYHMVTKANPVCSTLHNVVSLFHVLDKELEWRKSTGKPEGFGAMKASKPIVAVGPEHPLCDEELMADYFRKSNSFPFS